MEIDWEGMESFGSTFGIEWLVIILLILVILGIFVLVSRQMKSLANSVELLTTKFDPHLDTKQSLVFFKAVMNDDILKKLRFLGDILRVNSIQTRKDQIQTNIRREFKKITNEQCSKLSDIKSVCGDMGKAYLDYLKWDLIFNSVNVILFSEGDERQKIKDIRLLLESTVDSVAEVLEDNGVRN